MSEPIIKNEIIYMNPLMSMRGFSEGHYGH